uniref:Uncharacterized protein n=2 Tax=Spongospora subterranea TaxID=70186 RepID=A0A0H5QG03_9EUKA|eukprot:CRZ00983.1 hypothetical protein [Spongospora subterranea]
MVQSSEDEFGFGEESDPLQIPEPTTSVGKSQGLAPCVPMLQLLCVVGSLWFGGLLVYWLLSNHPGPSILVLVSLDGFRHDYLHHLSGNSSLLEIAQTGVHIERLKPCFPSLTFPNHYSIATGTYPETHGIIGNYFFDHHDKSWFSPKNSTQTKWWGAEPVWVTAEKQGRRTFVTSWPGSAAEIQNTRPSKYFDYDPAATIMERIDVASGWIRSEKPPSLIMVYIDEPDRSGHRFGPDSPQTVEAIHQVDSAIGTLMNAFPADNSNIDIMVVSDHGMTLVGEEGTVIDLDPFLNFSDPTVLRAICSPVFEFFPDPDLLPSLVEQLRLAQSANPKMVVYTKDEIPSRFHYSNNNRIAPVIAIASLGYVFSSKKLGCEFRGQPFGDHGYDNDEPQMSGFMVALGPSFKRGVHIPLSINTEIYDIVCHVLGVTPAPNNGTNLFTRILSKFT